MITLYGIEFADDETDIAIIDGKPEVMLNRKGVMRACDHAPDQVAADALREWLKTEPWKGKTGSA